MYVARLIVCIALKIVVLEMNALIKKMSFIIERFCYYHIVRLKLKINQVLVLPITMTPGDIRLGKKTIVS